MKRRVFFALIAIMSLSLIGIIFVQLYWIKQTLDAKEEQFSSNARQSLIKVAEKAKNDEIDKYYAKIAPYTDTLSPNSSSLSQLFHVEHNDLTNDTYLLTNSILQEDFKVRSGVTDLDSLNFKKFVNTKKVTLIKRDPSKSEMNLSASERFIRISRLNENEKIIIQEAIQDQSDKEPVYKRVTLADLKRSLNRQLSLRDINTPYKFGIYSNGLATKVSEGSFDINSPKSYGVSIFPSDKTNYKLYINFPEKQKELFSSILWLAGLSVIFIIIIILAFAGAIYQLLKQRRISEIKTDFINNMTHEFKTPIATINLALDAVKNPKISGDPKKSAHYLEMIRKENHRMHAQVENVLQISKLEKRNLDVERERVQLHKLIEDAVAHVSLIVKDRNGSIKTQLDAKRDSILANPSHLTNVIINLLDNAIKYSEGAPKIAVQTENIGEKIILLRVTDHGKGMTKKVQKRIFDKFYREHTGDLHNVKGHGLGLAYVKMIIDNHQGEISVESEKGKGSTFTIKLSLII